MSTTKAKPADATADTPRPRSKTRLALLALAPLVLAGGGYGGWIYYSGMEVDAAEAVAAKTAGQDQIQVAAVPVEIAAETSFTHSFALASIIAPHCGTVPTKALKTASHEEARADGLLVNLSWAAAARRTYTLDERTCRYLLSEVRNADAKAARIVEAMSAGETKH